MKEKVLSLMGFSLQRDSLKTEILSGLTTFITMVYILALMPVVYAPLGNKGFPVESVFTVTALGAIVGTLFMAFIAKRPFGQAPGLTLNVFFVHTICLSLGYPWQFALTAVLIEGLLFVLLCLSNMRQIIFDMVPTSLKHAIAVGIGFFIAMIGFKNSGILADGTIFNHMATLTSDSSILFIIGLVLTGIFTVMHVRGGLLLTIAIVTIIGIPMGVTKLPEQFFEIPTTPAPLFCQFSWAYLVSPDLWVCVLVMLFFCVMIAGTLYLSSVVSDSMSG
jgi:AGZA family xanthine/uracil permease-like MFS transporter